MRKKIVAGNWKMNLNKEEAYLLFNNLESKSFPSDGIVIIAPPSIYLDSFSGATNIYLSSQDVSANENGAFTGEFDFDGFVVKESGTGKILSGFFDTIKTIEEAEEIQVKLKNAFGVETIIEGYNE